MLGIFVLIGMGDAEGGSRLPKAVAAALQGRAELFAPYFAVLAEQTALDPELSFSRPLHNSIWCSEELVVGSPEELERRSAGTSAIAQRAFTPAYRAEYETCEVWPVPEAPAEFFEPVFSRIPTYLIAGALDVSTPVQYAWQALRYLPRGQLTVISAAGHIASEQGCGPELVERFYDAPYARVQDDCASAPIPFVP